MNEVTTNTPTPKNSDHMMPLFTNELNLCIYCNLRIFYYRSIKINNNMMNDEKRKTYEEAQFNFLGYPCNMAYDYSEVYDSLKYHFNNVGNPYEDSLYRVNTKEEERRVLAFFEDLWGFDKKNVWGYLTANGTEGNLQAFFIARQLYPNAVAYTSMDTHYSIAKICKILQLPLCMVKSRENGEMDYDDFERLLVENKDKPVIVNANLGTTMLGATDNTREIYRILCKHNKQNEYYMHGDGALMGFVLPFIEKDLFFRKCLHSISISGHKFLGVPIPSGVFMMEKRLFDIVNNHIDYVGTDCTISGSRNGHSALFFDHIIQQKGKDGFNKDIMDCIDKAEYMITKMNKHGLEAWRNQNSLIVVTQKPCESVIRKWQIPVHTHHHGRKQVSHAVILPHVTKQKINTFIRDVRLCK